MKQVVILSGLLAVALVGSYVTWTSDDAERSVDGAVVYTATEADLQKIVWKSDKADIELEKRADAQGDHVWIVATEREEVKVGPLPEGHPPIAEKDADGATDAAPESADEEEPDDAEGEDEDEDAEGEEPEVEVRIEETVTAFLGNSTAEDVWADFAPLEALRELGPVSGTDLSALGFDEPAATLIVHRGSGPLELVVGGETYGSRDRYVKAGDTLYLIDDATLRPIEYAMARLVERSLHPLAEKDTERVVVEDAEGRSVELVQQNADDRAKAYWALATTPDTADDSAATWLGKVFRMRVNGYVDEAEVTLPLETLFTYRISGEDKTWTIEIVREVADEQKREYYARSNYNRGLVRLTRSLASDVAADLDAVFQE